MEIIDVLLMYQIEMKELRKQYGDIKRTGI